ncbi:MAG: hypothetical protein JWQ83_1464, partial [Lacunisphaera sp.]|nr:hypothetical protein [Lacunisphaera sp.]
MAIDRQTISKVLFALSVPLTALALVCFALPVIGTVSGNYEEGMDGMGFYFFYALLAAPAAA